MSGVWRQPFILFAAGALLYAATVVVCVRAGVEDLLTCLVLVTPLFGLPYLLLGGRAGWRLALYLLLLPAIHYAAILAAFGTVDWPRGIDFVPGAVGGVIGAALSFASLVILRLAKPGRIGTMAAAVSLLALLGGVGVREQNFLGGTPLSDYGLVFSLYLPWQLVFGFLLARLLRGPKESVPAPADACPEGPPAA